MTTDVRELLDEALESGDDSRLRHHLVQNSGLPGRRMNLRLVTELARAVGAVVGRPDAPSEDLADMLDRWAALESMASSDDPDLRWAA